MCLYDCNVLVSSRVLVVLSGSLEAEATAASAASHHIPLTGVNKRHGEMSLQHFEVTRTPLAFWDESAFAHYANHIDSVSNAFIRLITPEVKSIHSK